MAEAHLAVVSLQFVGKIVHHLEAVVGVNQACKERHAHSPILKYFTHLAYTLQ